MDIEIKLTENCHWCYRGQHEERKPKKCEFCDGTGEIPTQLGKEILKLIKDHLQTESSVALELKNEHNEFYG